MVCGQLITVCRQKAAGLLNRNALNMQFVAQVPRRIPLQAMVSSKKPLALRKRAILRKRKTGLFLSGAVTFFRKESMQRLARGFASLACRLGRCSTFATGKQHPLTPAAYTATRQSEQSSVAVEGGATRTGDHGVNWLAAS